jgi:hypothetical protein
MPKPSAAAALIFSACMIRFLSTPLLRRSECLPLPRSFISSRRTLCFQSGWNVLKFLLCVFSPIPTPFTKRRIRWSAVFDHAAVFDPGYEERFRRAGHPGAFLLPHAVRKDLLAGADPLREFEIAWVGQTSGEFYKNRAEWLPKLAHEFHSNDWSRPYTVEEVANVYRRAQIVVNIGHDPTAPPFKKKPRQTISNPCMIRHS